MAKTPDRRSTFPMGSSLLTDEVLLDRDEFGSGILFLEPPGWYGTFDPTLPSDSARRFPGSDHLGPSEGLHGPNLPDSLAGGNNMRERGETRGHATEVTDVLRKRVVAWWGQYGEKLDETNSDLASAREKKKRKEMLEKILVLPKQTLLARASSLDESGAAFPTLKCCNRVPFQAHWLECRPSPSTSPSVLVVSNNLERWRPRRSFSGLGPSISLCILTEEEMQPYVSPGAHDVPVDPEQSLPRSFPGGSGWSTVRHQAPLLACWWSRTTLIDGVPEGPLLVSGRVSYGAYWLGKYCIPVSHWEHTLFRSILVDPEQSLPQSFPGGSGWRR